MERQERKESKKGRRQGEERGRREEDERKRKKEEGKRHCGKGQEGHQYHHSKPSQKQE
jgi:hypothetical protein